MFGSECGRIGVISEKGHGGSRGHGERSGLQEDRAISPASWNSRRLLSKLQRICEVLISECELMDIFYSRT